MLKKFKPRDSQLIGYGQACLATTPDYYSYLEFFICLADEPLELVLTILQSHVPIGSLYLDVQLQRFSAALEKAPYPYPEEWYLNSLREHFRREHEIVRVIETPIPLLQKALQTMFPQAAWAWLNNKFIRPA